MKLNAVILWVADLRACERFYRDVLGLEEVYRDEIVCLLSSGESALVLHRTDVAHEAAGSRFSGRPWPGGRSEDDVGRHSLRFEVDDPDAWHRRLVTAGVTVLDPPSDYIFGRGLVVSDPEGRAVCLARMAFPVSEG